MEPLNYYENLNRLVSKSHRASSHFLSFVSANSKFAPETLCMSNLEISSAWIHLDWEKDTNREGVPSYLHSERKHKIWDIISLKSYLKTRRLKKCHSATQRHKAHFITLQQNILNWKCINTVGEIKILKCYRLKNLKFGILSPCGPHYSEI